MTAIILRFPIRETEEPAREPLSRLGAAALIAMLAASVAITVAGISAIVTMVLSWVL